MLANVGLLLRLMANDCSVRSMGSCESYVTAETRPLSENSCRTIDLIRSLTSCSGNRRSTRASPSTSPLRAKWPTPELKRITRDTGRFCAPRNSGLLSGADVAELDSRTALTTAAPTAGVHHSSLRMAFPSEELG